MNITTKKLRPNCWELYLVPPDEYVTGRDTYSDINEARLASERLYRHDELVKLINEELLAWDGVMYSRQAYDRWHWYDLAEMNRFITYFTLKWGVK